MSHLQVKSQKTSASQKISKENRKSGIGIGMAMREWNPSDFEVEEEDEEEEETPSPSSISSPFLYFDRDRHVAFLEMMYNLIPYHYQSQEINRLTLAFFTISGLHLLQALDRVTFNFVFFLFLRIYYFRKFRLRVWAEMLI